MNDGRDIGLREWAALTACPGCGYSLVGLGGEGVCPECGRGFDGGWVVLWGVGPGGGKWQGVVWLGFWVVVLGWVVVSGRVGMAHLQGTVMAVIAVMMLGVGAYVRLFSSEEPRTQLWMSGEGLVQTVSTAEGRMGNWVMTTGWRWLMPVMMFAPVVQDLRLVGRVQLALGVAYGLMGGWFGLRGARGVGGDWMPRLVDWGRVEQIRVEELSGGRARIRCLVGRYWGSLLVNRAWDVDIVVACPAELVEGVRGMMGGWWEGGGGRRG